MAATWAGLAEVSANAAEGVGASVEGEGVAAAAAGVAAGGCMASRVSTNQCKQQSKTGPDSLCL